VETDLKHRLAQAERDLAHYRPTSIQFEAEFRALRHQFSAVQSQAVASETECRKALGMVNDLQQRLATTDAARQKMQEENNAYRQKLQRNEVTLPTLLRETAQLKSDLAAAKSDREHLEGNLETIARKFALECEEHNRVKDLLTQVQTQLTQLQNESQGRIADAEERATHGAEKLAGYEQQIHDLEIRQSALLSKVDFLNRINQRQRDDLRRQNDHIGNLEASNRQLLEGALPVAMALRAGEATLMDLESQSLGFRAVGE
jgi:chromosome segregation ATPase